MIARENIYSLKKKPEPYTIPCTVTLHEGGDYFPEFKGPDQGDLGKLMGSLGT